MATERLHFFQTLLCVLILVSTVPEWQHNKVKQVCSQRARCVSLTPGIIPTLEMNISLIQLSFLNNAFLKFTVFAYDYTIFFSLNPMHFIEKTQEDLGKGKCTH